MSEGGIYPWKRQDVCRDPKIADYSQLQNPLPQLPKGSEWFRDPNTREWKVIEVNDRHNQVGNEGDKEATTHVAVDTTSKAGALLPNDSDFLSHKVLTSDTLQGICLKYHTTPTQLRQLNRFSGSNLALAPAVLVIPLKQSTITVQKSPLQEKEAKINSFLSTFRFSKNSGNRTIGRKEALAYLEINDFNLEEAIADAKDDIGWESRAHSTVHANENSNLLPQTI